MGWNPSRKHWLPAIVLRFGERPTQTASSIRLDEKMKFHLELLVGGVVRFEFGLLLKIAEPHQTTCWPTSAAPIQTINLYIWYFVFSFWRLGVLRFIVYAPLCTAVYLSRVALWIGCSGIFFFFWSSGC